MPPLRTVLDNNVVLSAVLFPNGRLSWLQMAWQAVEIVPLISDETLGELSRVLDYRKFDLTPVGRSLAMNSYHPWCEMVSVTETPDVPECRNPNDRAFLELALVARADALVTGDGDLLALPPVFAVPIITPVELRTWIVE